MWAFLLALPTTAAAGPYLIPVNVGFGELYAFRVLVLVGFPVVLLAAPRLGWVPRVVAAPLLFTGLLWVAWGLASLSWTPDPKAGAVELTTILIGASAAGCIILIVGTSRERFRIVALGWAAAFSLVAVTAAWELLSGQHLQSQFVEAMAARDAGAFVTATFGNPNALGAFLLMTEALFLLQLFSGGSWRKRVPWAMGLGLVPILMALGGCRTALIGTVVCVGIFGWTLCTWRQRVWFLLGGTALSVVALWTIMRITGLDLAAIAATWQLGGELQYGGSAGLRLNLLRNGIGMMLGTAGCGVGAGGFVYAIEHGYGVFDTGGIVNPHNYWLEIGSQYGLLVLLAVVMVLLWWAILLLRDLSHARKHRDRRGRVLVASGLAGLAAYTIAAGSNSTFIPQPTNWVFLGTLAALVATSASRTANVEEC
mgnify:CR=1 FL=1